MGFETLVTNEGYGKVHDGHGGYWERGYTTELIALETEGSGGITTISVSDLLPANARIEAVTARITTTFINVTTWAIGDEYISDRFADPSSLVVAGTVVVGLNHIDNTASSPVLGARQSSAGKLTITTGSQPEAGAVRVTVYYSRFVAPTS